MRQTNADRFAELLEPQQSPCISLYQPTHRKHGDNAQDTIRFGNLLKQLESSLREHYNAGQVREATYLERLSKLTEKFGEARFRNAGSSDLSDVAKAAVADQVATLLVEADRVIPGVVDRSTGAVGESDPTRLGPICDRFHDGVRTHRCHLGEA